VDVEAQWQVGFENSRIVEHCWLTEAENHLRQDLDFWNLTHKSQSKAIARCQIEAVRRASKERKLVS